MLSPRAKMHQYMNLVLADMQAKAVDSEAWSILLDENGNLAEGTGSNIFLVKDGRVRTPRERYVLPGVSRATVIELGAKLGIPIEEADIDLYDASDRGRDFRDLDQPGRVSGIEVQRRHGGRRSRAGADHETVDLSLHRARRLRLRAAIHAASGLSREPSFRSNIGYQTRRSLSWRMAGLPSSRAVILPIRSRGPPARQNAFFVHFGGLLLVHEATLSGAKTRCSCNRIVRHAQDCYHTPRSGQQCLCRCICERQL